MAFVLNGIGVLHDGGDLGDVAKTFTRNKLKCEEDTFNFWSLEKLVCVCVCVCVVLTYILPKYVYDFTKHNQITYQTLFKF